LHVFYRFPPAGQPLVRRRAWAVVICFHGVDFHRRLRRHWCASPIMRLHLFAVTLRSSMLIQAFVDVIHLRLQASCGSAATGRTLATRRTLQRPPTALWHTILPPASLLPPTPPALRVSRPLATTPATPSSAASCSHPGPAVTRCWLCSGCTCHLARTLSRTTPLTAFRHRLTTMVIPPQTASPQPTVRAVPSVRAQLHSRHTCRTV